MDFIPDPSLQKQSSSNGFMPDPNQSAAALGHSTSLIQKLIGGAENLLPTAGAIAGGIGGAALGVLGGAETGPGAAVTGYAGGVAGSGAGAAAGEALKEKLQGQPLQGGEIAKQGGINAAFDAVGGPLLSVAGKALGKVASPIVSAVGKGAAKVADMFGGSGGAQVAKTVAEKTGLKDTDEQAIIKALTPKMSPKQLKDAAKAGKGVVPKFGAPKIDLTKDKQFMKTVDAVKGLVQGKSAIEDINNVDEALGAEADKLKSAVQKSGQDRIYPFKELNATLNAVEKPIVIKSDTTLSNQFDMVRQAAMDISKKNGGTISSLLDSRKEFDQLVEKQFPTLYDRENAPMRGAVTAIRSAMNDFIEENLPKEVGYKESLQKQKLFYNAIDNLVTKVPDEIRGGATFAKRHPVLTKGAKWAGSGAAAAVGAGTVYEGGKLLGE